MATTESHKIPPTVLSRSQKIDFHLLSPFSIKNHLEKICNKEAFKISETLLWLLAKQAHGSLRDAQSLLDQVITFCGGAVKEEEVRQLLGLSDSQTLGDCVQALIERKEVSMLQIILNLRTKGLEPRIFLQNLIESITQLLFLKKESRQ